MAYIPTGITSIVNTVPSSVIVGASIFGLPPVNVTNTNLNVGGSVISFQGGTIVTSLVSTIPSSVIVGTSIFGQLPAGTAVLGSVATLQGTNPWTVVTPAASITSVTTPGGSIMSITTPAGSVLATSAISPAGSITSITIPAGSITAVSATAPAGSIMATNQVAGSIMGVSVGSVAAFIVGSASIITVWKDSSVLSVPVGSTITILQAASIAGTYAEDAAHTSADKGLFMLAVRNDTVASFASADTDYAPHAVDAPGRLIVKPFAGENATIISYVGSTVSGSVQLIQASVIGSKSYVTDFWLSNTGAATTLVTFQDGSTSILGQFIAPTGGGMSSPGIAIPIKTFNSQDLAFKVSPSSSVVYVVVKGYQAQ